MARTAYARSPAQTLAAAACTAPVMVALLIALLTLDRLPAEIAPAIAPLLVFDVKPPPPPPPIVPESQVKPSPAKVRGPGGGRPRASLRPIDPSPPILPVPHVVDPGIARMPVDVLGNGSATGGSGPGTGGGDGGGTPESLAPRTRITLANWARYPSVAEVSFYYPSRARRERTAGSVLLACHVTLKERTRGCFVLRERPLGYGFGDAAIAASRIFRIHPVQVDGVAVDDGLVAIPVTFRN